MHFWGAILDRVHRQTWVVEPPLELNAGMYPSSASTARSLAKEYTSKEVLGNLTMGLEFVKEGTSA